MKFSMYLIVGGAKICKPTGAHAASGSSVDTVVVGVQSGIQAIPGLPGVNTAAIPVPVSERSIGNAIT